MNAAVDTELCTGCGLCEGLCPDVFVMDRGVARIRATDIAPGAAESFHRAARRCPVTAITAGEARAFMLAGIAGEEWLWVAL